MSKMMESERGVIQVKQTRRAAATDRWYLWAIAVIGLVMAAYFHTHPDIWTMRAEVFYVLIFGGAAFLAIVAGAYTIYTRPSWAGLP